MTAFSTLEDVIAAHATGWPIGLEFMTGVAKTPSEVKELCALRNSQAQTAQVSGAMLNGSTP